MVSSSAEYTNNVIALTHERRGRAMETVGATLRETLASLQSESGQFHKRVGADVRRLAKEVWNQGARVTKMEKRLNPNAKRDCHGSGTGPVTIGSGAEPSLTEMGGAGQPNFDASEPVPGLSGYEPPAAGFGWDGLPEKDAGSEEKTHGSDIRPRGVRHSTEYSRDPTPPNDGPKRKAFSRGSPHRKSINYAETGKQTESSQNHDLLSTDSSTAVSNGQGPESLPGSLKQ